jgi:ribose 5-phosphate isomerase B
MRIVIASDHAGYRLKKYIVDRLEDRYEFIDVGVYSEEPVDYPDYAIKACRKILDGEADLGILICGTGIGMCIVANKFRGIYAALIYSHDSARLARQHNNANVICLGGRTMNYDDAVMWVEAWLGERFEGGRHLRRINKIMEVEASLCGRRSR